jgi:hypothetical protein
MGLAAIHRFLVLDSLKFDQTDLLRIINWKV